MQIVLKMENLQTVDKIQTLETPIRLSFFLLHNQAFINLDIHKQVAIHCIHPLLVSLFPLWLQLIIIKEIYLPHAWGNRGCVKVSSVMIIYSQALHTILHYEICSLCGLWVCKCLGSSAANSSQQPQEAVHTILNTKQNLSVFSLSTSKAFCIGICEHVEQNSMGVCC